MSLPKPYFDDDHGIVLYHANCREILPELNGIDLVLTDPPYRIETDGGGIGAKRDFYRDDHLAGMRDFVLADYTAVLRACAPQLVAFHSRAQVEEYARFCRESYGHYDLHFWHKINPVPFTNNTWLSDVEYIALGYATKKHANVPLAMKSKVYTSSVSRENFHPAGKPVPLMLKYLTVLAPQSVVDPFCGSGSTLLAAKLNGVRAVGVELEERWCEVAARRLSQNILDFGEAL